MTADPAAVFLVRAFIAVAITLVSGIGLSAWLLYVTRPKQ